MAIKTNKDIPVGSIVTSKRGNKYLVLADDAGQRGLFTKTGTWMRFNGDALTFGKNGDTIQTIQQFDTLPTLDAVSEGLKMMYTGRAASAPLTTIYTAEHPAVTEAKGVMADCEAKMQAAMDTIRRYS